MITNRYVCIQNGIGLKLVFQLFCDFTCTCVEIVDQQGHHPISCYKNAGGYFKHAEVNTLLKKGLVSVVIAAQLEPTDIDPDDGKRSDKATIVP